MRYSKILSAICMGALLLAACTPAGNTAISPTSPSHTDTPIVGATSTPLPPKEAAPIVITRDQHGRLFQLQVGQRIILNLEEGFDWSIDISNPAILSQVEGEPGVYQAMAAGEATLTANGDPVCRKQKPACMMPSVSFSVEFQAGDRPGGEGNPPVESTATPTGAWIQLIPPVARPGETIEVVGFLPGGPDQAQAEQDSALQHANLCWQSCFDGLVEVGREVKWSAEQPGRFTTQLLVPPAPWLSTQGMQTLEPGPYTITIQCLGPDLDECALQEGLAQAELELHNPNPSLCSEGGPCVEMILSSVEAVPGQFVQANGWAPLVQLSGEMPFGYSLVIQIEGQHPAYLGPVNQELDGSFSGEFQVPQIIPGEGVLVPGEYIVSLQAVLPQPGAPEAELYLAPTEFKITPAEGWAGLGAQKPVRIERAANLTGTPEVTVDPGNAGRLAGCTTGEIQYSQDGGATWTPISTAGVEQAAEDAGYPLMSTEGSAPTCSSIIMDPTHPQSLFAVFNAMDAQYGAPPVYFLGFQTLDLGET